MSLEALIADSRIEAILTHPDEDTTIWRTELDRFLNGDTKLTRRSANEDAIEAIQRMMIFLGYSTSSTGAFAIDGDFGRGTNRGVAQFQVEHRLTTAIKRSQLCYPCKWNTAKSLIHSIPEARLTPKTLETMAQVAVERIDSGAVMCGSLEDALFNLNALHGRKYLNCRKIFERYGDAAVTVSQRVREQKGIVIRPPWILSIIRQETAGIIRPRFEQHYLSRLNRQHPNAKLETLRMRSMSHGLGQIMGENYERIGAASPEVLYSAPIVDQVGFVAAFLSSNSFQPAVSKNTPSDADYRRVAKYYNGSGYEKHHYHEALERWFNEFSALF